MDTQLFLTTFIENLNKIKENEALLFNVELNEIELEKKEAGNDTMEFKNFKSNMIKTVKEKNKANYDTMMIKKNEADNNEHKNINILEDDIFHNNEDGDNNEEFKLNIDELNKEDKEKLIYEYMKRKNIYLDENGYRKIEELLNDETFIFKKHITVSKMYQQVTKISFLRKLENGGYMIDTSEKKIKNKNIFFK